MGPVFRYGEMQLRSHMRCSELLAAACCTVNTIQSGDIELNNERMFQELLASAMLRLGQHAGAWDPRSIRMTKADAVDKYSKHHKMQEISIQQFL